MNDTQYSSAHVYLTVADLREMFGCGRSKAYRIMSTLPSVKIGSRNMISLEALDEYLEEHHGVIKVRWPK